MDTKRQNTTESFFLAILGAIVIVVVVAFVWHYLPIIIEPTFVRIAEIVIVIIAALKILFLFLLANAANKRNRIKIILNQVHAELKQSQEYLAEAEQLAELGRFNWNVLTDSLIANGELHKLFGFSEKDMRISFNDLQDAVIADDAEVFTASLKNALYGTSDTFSMTFRIRPSIGKEKHLYAICAVRRSPRGEPICVLGTVQEMSAHKNEGRGKK